MCVCVGLMDYGKVKEDEGGEGWREREEGREGERIGRGQDLMDYGKEEQSIKRADVGVCLERGGWGGKR